MKITTTLHDDNDNVLARVETIDDFEAHEGQLYKIEQAIERMTDGQIDADLIDSEN